MVVSRDKFEIAKSTLGVFSTDIRQSLRLSPVSSEKQRDGRKCRNNPNRERSLFAFDPGYSFGLVGKSSRIFCDSDLGLLATMQRQQTSGQQR